jgi:hypothetical protein
MTDTTRTANNAASAFTTSKRAERKSTGLIECVIVSLAGLGITMLLMAHDIPTAMQLTVMQ